MEMGERRHGDGLRLWILMRERAACVATNEGGMELGGEAWR